MENDSKKVDKLAADLLKLEQILKVQEREIRELKSKIQFLERENSRRKQDIQTVANHLRKG